MNFEIPEAFIGELNVGDTVGIESWSASAGKISGEIVDIGSRIDPRNRTFVARAKVDNSQDQLRPGMSFRVGIDVQGNEYPVVSETGVQWGADGAYVWAIVDGLATRVPVQVIQRREGRVLIDGDLQSGDVIVVEGTQRMRDGTAVSYDAPRLARKTRDAASPVISGGSAVTLD